MTEREGGGRARERERERERERDRDREGRRTDRQGNRPSRIMANEKFYRRNKTRYTQKKENNNKQTNKPGTEISISIVIILDQTAGHANMNQTRSTYLWG